MQFWKISDFTDEIKKVLGEEKLNRKTVATWFNKMEELGIHYINRTEDTNEKVYDELDLKIGIFIKEKRNQNWSLNAIFNEVRDTFDVRPFPIEKQENALQVNPPHFYQQVLPKFDLKSFKQELMTEIRAAFEQVVAGQMAEVKERYDQLLEKMPDFPTDDDAREKRFQEIVLRRRVEFQLEKEALLIWSAKPESERFKKIGWFRKEEDLTKRDLFVKDYVNRHFAGRMRNEIFFANKDQATNESERKEQQVDYLAGSSITH